MPTTHANVTPDLPTQLHSLLHCQTLTREQVQALVATGAYQVISYWVGGQGNLPILEPVNGFHGPRWHRRTMVWRRINGE